MIDSKSLQHAPITQHNNTVQITNNKNYFHLIFSLFHFYPPGVSVLGVYNTSSKIPNDYNTTLLFLWSIEVYSFFIKSLCTIKIMIGRKLNYI